MITLEKLLDKERAICDEIEVLNAQMVSLQNKITYTNARRDVIAELISEAKSEQVECETITETDTIVE